MRIKRYFRLIIDLVFAFAFIYSMFVLIDAISIWGIPEFNPERWSKEGRSGMALLFGAAILFFVFTPFGIVKPFDYDRY